MTYDLAVDEDGCLRLDNFGDIATVDGEDNVTQQIRLAIIESVGTVSVAPFTDATLRELRRDIREGLQRCPYVDRIVAVRVRAENDESLQITVRTESRDITMNY